MAISAQPMTAADQKACYDEHGYITFPDDARSRPRSPSCRRRSPSSSTKPSRSRDDVES